MKCKTCGSDKMHICCIDADELNECEYCGAVLSDSKHLCDEDTTYICNTCGRTAIKAEELCNPTPKG